MFHYIQLITFDCFSISVWYIMPPGSCLASCSLHFASGVAELSCFHTPLDSYTITNKRTIRKRWGWAVSIIHRTTGKIKVRDDEFTWTARHHVAVASMCKQPFFHSWKESPKHEGGINVHYSGNAIIAKPLYAVIANEQDRAKTKEEEN